MTTVSGQNYKINNLTLYLDSRDRLAGGISTNCTIQLSTPIYNVKRCRVTRFTTYNSVYTVNLNNNLLVLILNTITYNVILPIGNYTVYTLLTKLQNSINTTTSQNTTVTYSDNLLLYTISGFSTPCTFVSATSTINQLIGFTLPQVGTNLVSNTFVNLSPVDYISISSSYLGPLVKNITATGAFASNLLKRITVDVTSEYLIDYKENYNPEPTPYDSSVDISYIDIQLYDQTSKLLQLNSEWNMELLIERWTPVTSSGLSGSAPSGGPTTANVNAVVDLLKTAVFSIQKTAALPPVLETSIASLTYRI